MVARRSVHVHSCADNLKRPKKAPCFLLPKFSACQVVCARLYFLNQEKGLYVVIRARTCNFHLVGPSLLGVAVARSVATVSIHSSESGAPQEEIVGRIALREGLECGVAGYAHQRRLLLPLLAAWK
jgi:hypothetical protein